MARFWDNKPMYYVYEHWRPDTNTCFYVGKGRGRRAWQMRSRNKYHTSIVSKLTSMGLAVEVKIIVTDLTEKIAFMVEIDLITKYGRENLSNMTKGGDGVVGMTREKIMARAAKHIGKKRKPETRKKIAEARAKQTFSEETRKKLSLAGKKRQHSDETKKKMSERLMGNKRASGRKMSAANLEALKKVHIGKVVSIETKAKLSEARKAYLLRRAAA